MRLVLTFIFSIAALPMVANANNRIIAPASPGVRCTANAPSKGECSEYNKWAVDSGCITQEEFDTLARFSSVASCSLNIHDRSKFILVGWCSCGCFEGKTPILTNEGYLSAKTVATNFSKIGLVNMDSQSRLSRPEMNVSRIRNSTVGAEPKPLVVLTVEGGQVLRVTEKHAILTSEGKMVQAYKLKVGDGLVTVDGKVAKIAKVGSEKTRGKVYNFAVESEKPTEHIIVANGLLVGDLLWQNSLQDMQNQILIRQ